MLGKLKAAMRAKAARKRIEDYERQYRISKPISERPSPLPVEETFDAFVKDFGGEKISDLISSKSQMPLNADYLFREQNIVAELKTLSGIFSGESGLRQISQALIDSGQSDIDAMSALIGQQKMPEGTAALIKKRMRRSIEQRIKQARKQIKLSKRMFGNEDTKCIILFAMDQDPLFGHRTMLANIARIMETNYSDEHTDGVVYFNPNRPTKVTPDGMEYAGWYPFYRDSDTNQKLSEFVDLLGNRWLNFFGERIGEVNPVLQMSSIDELMYAFGNRW